MSTIALNVFRMMALCMFVPACLAQDATSSIEELEKRLEQLKAEEAQKAKAARAAAERERQRAADRARQAEAQADPSQIRLDTGLMLSDWLLLAEARLAKGEDEAVFSEGLTIFRKYPKATALKVLMDRAVAERVARIKIHSPESAQAALPQLESLLESFPDQTNARLRAGQARHLLGEFEQAADHYRQALAVIPADAAERMDVLQWFQKAIGGEALNMDIAPIRERPLPDQLMKYQKDIEQALACVGKATAAFDYIYSTDGIIAESGNSFNQRLRVEAHGRGLSHMHIESTQDNEYSTNNQSINTIFFGQWMEMSGRWVAGSLMGTTNAMRNRTFDISCDQTLFPLEVGKRVVGRQKIESWNKTVGTSDKTYLNSSTRTVMQTDWDLEIGDELDADTMASRYSFIRLLGPSSQNWRMFEMKYASRTNYLELEVAPEARQYYKPLSNSVSGVFIEGPNVFVDSDAKGIFRSRTITLQEAQ